MLKASAAKHPAALCRFQIRQQRRPSVLHLMQASHLTLSIYQVQAAPGLPQPAYFRLSDGPAHARLATHIRVSFHDERG